MSPVPGAVNAGLRAVGAGLRAVGGAVRAMQCAVCIAAATAAHAATISADQLAQCAAITASDSRLACYDSLATRSAGGPAPMTGAGAPPSSQITPGGTATFGAAGTPTASAKATVAPVSSAPTNFAENDPKNFGLSRAQLHETAPGPGAVHARIEKVVEDQPGHTIIVLDNEQTWTCSDNDGRLDAGGLVTIKRGAVGSFTMLTSSNHVYKVHRVR